MDQEDDYRIGYGKPPRESQFKKGRSSNPNGRPKMPTDPYAHFDRVLNKTIVVTEDGQRKTVSKPKALMTQLVNKALSGDASAMRLVLKQVEHGLPSRAFAARICVPRAV